MSLITTSIGSVKESATILFLKCEHSQTIPSASSLVAIQLCTYCPSLAYSIQHPFDIFNMSDLVGSVTETKNGFHVDGYERISYDFTFLDGVFHPENRQLAECYKSWGRVLAVTDLNVYNVYGEQIEKYFQHHGLELKVHKTKIGEKAKTIPTFLSIVDSMTEFGIYRKVLAILFVSSVVVLATIVTDFCRNRFWSLGVAL